MKANLASIEINGKTLKKGTSVTLDFGMGPMTEEVFDIFMDGNKEITIETVQSRSNSRRDSSCCNSPCHLLRFPRYRLR